MSRAHCFACRSLCRSTCALSMAHSFPRSRCAPPVNSLMFANARSSARVPCSFMRRLCSTRLYPISTSSTASAASSTSDRLTLSTLPHIDIIHRERCLLNIRPLDTRPLNAQPRDRSATRCSAAQRSAARSSSPRIPTQSRAKLRPREDPRSSSRSRSSCRPVLSVVTLSSRPVVAAAALVPALSCMPCGRQLRQLSH
jgi:hypothetical protein